MAKEKSLSPLTSTESSRIQFGFDTPGYIHSETLAVDLNALSLLCALGGIRRLLIKWADNEETATPAISGIAIDGTATMANTLAAKRNDETNVTTSDGIVKEAREIDVTIELDREDILETLSRKGQLHEPQAWARTLDRRIKRQVLKSGLELLMRPGGMGAFSDAVTTLCYPIMVSSALPYDDINREVILRIAITSLQMFTVIHIITRLFLSGTDGARFSWIQPFGTEPFRAIRFTGFLLSSKVIHSVPREQEEIE